jgi:hypothetical protein
MLHTRVQQQGKKWGVFSDFWLGCGFAEDLQLGAR